MEHPFLILVLVPLYWYNGILVTVYAWHSYAIRKLSVDQTLDA